jgi:hypothetical protein
VGAEFFHADKQIKQTKQSLCAILRKHLKNQVHNFCIGYLQVSSVTFVFSTKQWDDSNLDVGHPVALWYQDINKGNQSKNYLIIKQTAIFKNTGICFGLGKNIYRGVYVISPQSVRKGFEILN